MSGFDNRQLKKLATPLDRARVQSREREGKTLAYIEGWFAIAEANRIFGYDGWDREMVHFERLFARTCSDGASCAYIARVRVRVRARETIIVREGSGFGQAFASAAGDAYERALKAAETDATKRALATFGGRFGLMLYEKPPARASDTSVSGSDGVGAVDSAKDPSPHGEHMNATLFEVPKGLNEKNAPRSAGTLMMYRLVGSDGSACEVRSAESFCSGLRQLVEASRTREDIDRISANNKNVLLALRSLPNLRSTRGDHFADILDRLMARRRRELSDGSAEVVDPVTIKQVQKTEPGTGVRKDALGSAPRSFYMPYVPVPPFPLAKVVQCLRTKSGQQAENATVGNDSAHEEAPSHESTVPSATASVLALPQPSTLVPTRRSRISGGLSIDKSVFAIPSERRLRSKAHLAFVASKPCLVCGGLPCHAHHVTFAQPRGLSLKVSDEFTVPLCVVHHNELHASGNEAGWWRAQGIEPLIAAEELWRTSMGANEDLP